MSPAKPLEGPAAERPMPLDFPIPNVELLEEDGVPLETPWHRNQIALLGDPLSWLWRDRDDFYTGGNMFIYYSVKQAKTLEYRGPDFFYVEGVERHKPRKYWVVWEEDGQYPDMIIELLSPSTARQDRTTKKDIYEKKFHTHEYFCYDPDERGLEGWRLDTKRRYQAIRANEKGWMWSQELGLWIGTWEGEYLGMTGVWLRYYDAAGTLVPTQAEAREQRAEEEHRRAETERQRAESEHRRAEAERQRAETAEAELAQLRAKLAELETKPAH